MSASKPRPIHSSATATSAVSRDLRETPDEAEPSYSYEDSAFMGGLEDDVEDEFHRRLAITSRQPAVVGGSSFWRTDVPTLPTQPVTLKERKSSGGLLGAALQLHSQSDSAAAAAAASSSSSSHASSKDRKFSAEVVRTKITVHCHPNWEENALGIVILRWILAHSFVPFCFSFNFSFAFHSYSARRQSTGHSPTFEGPGPMVQ